jgi:hypothetical protein
MHYVSWLFPLDGSATFSNGRYLLKGTTSLPTASEGG